MNRWGEAQGQNLSFVTTIAQTPDGYLWLGTPSGLLRFNGTEFVEADPRPVDHRNSAPVPAITALLADQHGGLWIGTQEQGLYRWMKGNFTGFRAAQGLANDRIKCLLEDRTGRLWIGTDGGGIFCLENEHIVPLRLIGAETPSHPTAFAEDADGGVWIGTFSDGVMQVRDGIIVRRFRTSTVTSLLAMPAGGVWIGTARGLAQGTAGDPKPVPVIGRDRKPQVQPFITCLAQSTGGNLWIGTVLGLIRRQGDTEEYMDRLDGLGNGVVTALYTDAEESVWAGVEIGDLYQFRRSHIKVLRATSSAVQGIHALWSNPSGRVWVAGSTGLFALEAGQVVCRPGENGLPDQPVLAVAEDGQGRVWFCLRSEQWGYWRDGQTVYPNLKGLERPRSTVNCFELGSDGQLWVGTGNGLCRLTEDARLEVRSDLDLSHHQVLSLEEDRQGALWIGTGHGLNRLKHGVCEQFVDVGPRPLDVILTLRVDSENTLWIGTRSGLWRYRDGRFFAFGPEHGVGAGVGHIDEDASGRLWIEFGARVVRFLPADLNAVADGRAAHATPEVMADLQDRPRVGLIATDLGGLITPEGYACYASDDGLVLIDSQPVPRSRRPPPVALESAQVNGEWLHWPLGTSLGQPIVLPPRYHLLELRYAGLSLADPAAVRFRYRLLGLSDQWQEVGNRRAAYFQALPPGHYTFEVMAQTPQGILSASPARCEVQVLATWWQQTPVRLAGALALLGLFGASYSWRIRHLKQQAFARREFSRHLLDRQEHERRRIAKELHDGLGQDLLILKNQALMLSPDLPVERPDLRQRVEQMAEVSQHAIESARAMAHNLRPAELDRVGLTAALAAMIERSTSSSNLIVDTDLTDLGASLPSETEVQLYRIAQELINNLLKHSKATRTMIDLHQTPAKDVELVVADNGCGFDAAKVNSGLGFQSIQERVALVGGTCSFETRQGSGTRVIVRIPFRSA